jgi:pimeloyl-ACP methyl ester carboxylesterase
MPPRAADFPARPGVHVRSRPRPSRQPRLRPRPHPRPGVVAHPARRLCGPPAGQRRRLAPGPGHDQHRRRRPPRLPRPGPARRRGHPPAPRATHELADVRARRRRPGRRWLPRGRPRPCSASAPAASRATSRPTASIVKPSGCGRCSTSSRVATVTLVVHDLGGLVGWELLDRAPTRIARLLVLNTTAYDGSGHRSRCGCWRGRWAGVMASMMAGPTMGPGQTATFLKGNTGDPAHVDAATIDGVWWSLHEGSTRPMRAMARSFAAIGAEFPRYQAALRRFSGPARVLWGGRDRVLRGEVLVPRFLADLGLPASAARIVPDAGHFIVLDDPVAVTEAILALVHEAPASEARAERPAAGLDRAAPGRPALGPSVRLAADVADRVSRDAAIHDVRAGLRARGLIGERWGYAVGLDADVGWAEGPGLPRRRLSARPRPRQPRALGDRGRWARRPTPGRERRPARGPDDRRRHRPDGPGERARMGAGRLDPRGLDGDRVGGRGRPSPRAHPRVLSWRVPGRRPLPRGGGWRAERTCNRSAWWSASTWATATEPGRGPSVTGRGSACTSGRCRTGKDRCDPAARPRSPTARRSPPMTARRRCRPSDRRRDGSASARGG